MGYGCTASGFISTALQYNLPVLICFPSRFAATVARGHFILYVHEQRL